LSKTAQTFTQPAVHHPIHRVCLSTEIPAGNEESLSIATGKTMVMLLKSSSASRPAQRTASSASSPWELHDTAKTRSSTLHFMQPLWRLIS
jgi:hypothetical protein